MTLNGVMAVILRYFSEFAYLPGVLRKSSRSLSHLLMSSCLVLTCILWAASALLTYAPPTRHSWDNWRIGSSGTRPLWCGWVEAL